MLTRVAGLIFGTEVQRRPAAFIHSHMLLDLIEEQIIDFKKAFYESITITSYDANKDYFYVENWRGVNYWFPINKGKIYIYADDGHYVVTDMIISKDKDNYIIKKESTSNIISIYTKKPPKKNEFLFKILFKPWMPMAPSGATAMAVKLNKYHNSLGTPFSYIHNGGEEEPHALEQAEIDLVNYWLKHVAGLSEIDMTDSSKVIDAIESACVGWCGII